MIGKRESSPCESSCSFSLLINPNLVECRQHVTWYGNMSRGICNMSRGMVISSGM